MTPVSSLAPALRVQPRHSGRLAIAPAAAAAGYYGAMYPPERDLTAFDFRVVRTDALTDDDRAIMHALFDSNYREANHPYLDKSLGVLRFAAFATERATGDPAGFALADVRLVDLPRLPATAVALAGICCVGPAFRRRGLFSALEQRAMTASGVAPTGRMLSCGRMAHPASMRMMAQVPSSVPKPGVAITAWQRAIGRAVADLYGVKTFHDDTFVVEGSGMPIGYPLIEIDATPEEWVVFQPVDRDRGDSLLGIAWRGEPPDGWND